MDTSVTFKDLGDTMEIVFYGLSHGKNRYDGEGGVIKARAARNIRHGEVISSAKDLYKSCLTLEKEESNPDGSCNHNSRKLIWVDRESITYLKPDRECKSQRNKECTFGNGCILSDSLCDNKCVAGDWRTALLKRILYNFICFITCTFLTST